MSATRSLFNFVAPDCIPALPHLVPLAAALVSPLVIVETRGHELPA